MEFKLLNVMNIWELRLMWNNDIETDHVSLLLVRRILYTHINYIDIICSHA